MTRITNFGIKRKYVQAGFGEDDPTPVMTVGEGSSTTLETGPGEGSKTADPQDPSNPPPKKKRKRTPKSKRDGHAADRAAEAALNGDVVPSEPTPIAEKAEDDPGPDGEPALTRLQKKQKRNLARRMKGNTCSM